MRLEYSEKAEANLISIRDYGIEKWGMKNAQSYMESLFLCLDLITEQPKMGRAYADDNMYIFPFRRHQIFYEVSSETVYVLAILGNRQLPELHLS